MFHEPDQVQELFGFRIEINKPDCVQFRQTNPKSDHTHEQTDMPVEQNDSKIAHTRFAANERAIYLSRYCNCVKRAICSLPCLAKCSRKNLPTHESKVTL